MHHYKKQCDSEDTSLSFQTVFSDDPTNMHEVYQWRNHVFNAGRDIAKVKPLMAEYFE